MKRGAFFTKQIDKLLAAKKRSKIVDTYEPTVLATFENASIRSIPLDILMDYIVKPHLTMLDVYNLGLANKRWYVKLKKYMDEQSVIDFGIGANSKCYIMEETLRIFQRYGNQTTIKLFSMFDMRGMYSIRQIIGFLVKKHNRFDEFLKHMRANFSSYLNRSKFLKYWVECYRKWKVCTKYSHSSFLTVFKRENRAYFCTLFPKGTNHQCLNIARHLRFGLALCSPDPIIAQIFNTISSRRLLYSKCSDDLENNKNIDHHIIEARERVCKALKEFEHMCKMFTYITPIRWNIFRGSILRGKLPNNYETDLYCLYGMEQSFIAFFKARNMDLSKHTRKLESTIYRCFTVTSDLSRTMDDFMDEIIELEKQ